MSSPTLDVTAPAASTTAAATTSPAASASTTTTAPAATTTKKPASLKAVTSFGKLDPNVLVNTAHHVATGISGHLEYFGNPPVEPAALDASTAILSNAILSAMDGGKNAKAVRDKQRKLIIQDLNLLAVYVQNVAGGDPLIFAASNFTAKPTGKSAPQPVVTPSFRSLDYGVNSGQIAVSIKAVSGAKSYFIRYAVMNGTTPGPWTTVPAASIRKPITITNLTPVTRIDPGSETRNTLRYAFQISPLGNLGKTDWSDSITSPACHDVSGRLERSRK